MPLKRPRTRGMSEQDARLLDCEMEIRVQREEVDSLRAENLQLNSMCRC